MNARKLNKVALTLMRNEINPNLTQIRLDLPNGNTRLFAPDETGNLLDALDAANMNKTETVLTRIETLQVSPKTEKDAT